LICIGGLLFRVSCAIAGSAIESASAQLAATSSRLEIIGAGSKREHPAGDAPLVHGAVSFRGLIQGGVTSNTLPGR
jgi:hypothetical protein